MTHDLRSDLDMPQNASLSTLFCTKRHFWSQWDHQVAKKSTNFTRKTPSKTRKTPSNTRKKQQIGKRRRGGTHESLDIAGFSSCGPKTSKKA